MKMSENAKKILSKHSSHIHTIHNIIIICV